MPFNTIWPVGPLHSAKDVGLQSNPGTLPNMADTISNWFQLLVMERLVKTVVNFQVVETTTPIQFQGVVVPEPSRKLIMAPNGQRVWKSKTLYCYPNVPVAPDDVVLYENIQYRVLAGQDFKEYGYRSYILVQDFTGAGPVIS